MHTRLERDIRVCHTGSDQLAQRAQQERDERRDLAPPLHHIPQLLKQSILQDRVDDQHQRGQHAREQRQRPLLLQQRQKRAHGGWRLGLWSAGQRADRVGALARRHARVDHPDGVCEEDSGRAGQSAREHGLESREARGGAGLEEGRARPLVVVVVHEVGEGDADEGGVKAGVEAGGAVAGEKGARAFEEGGALSCGFDLGARGEGYEGVSGRGG